MTIPACPRCGDQLNDLFVNAVAIGTAQYWFSSGTGKYYEIFDDNSGYKLSHVVRCGACFKIRRDLKVSGCLLEVVTIDRD